MIDHLGRSKGGAWLLVLAGWLLGSQSLTADTQELDSVMSRLDALEAQMQASALDVKSVVHVDCGSPLTCPGWEVSAEALYLKPRESALDFALTEDGNTAIFGNGQIHQLDFDRNAGVRASLGYRTKTDWAVRFGYTHFETDGLAYAERPGGTGQLFPTRSQPDGFQEADSARAAATFQYQLFDVLADRPIFQNRFARVSVFGGVRWIDFEQTLHLDYNGRDFTNGRIHDELRMDGFGLRLGTEGRWQWAGGFAAFGSLAGGLTHGRYTTTIFEDNLDGTIVITDVAREFDQAVASLDARLGLGWNWRNVTLSGGYEMANWFGLADRSMFTDESQEATFASISNDVLLEGLFFQVGLVW